MLWNYGMSAEIVEPPALSSNMENYFISFMVTTFSNVVTESFLTSYLLLFIYIFVVVFYIYIKSLWDYYYFCVTC